MEVVFPSRLSYSDAVQTKGPGIAKAVSGHERLDLAERRTVVGSVLRDLDSLISRHAQAELSAFVWGTHARGGADLIQSFGGRESEALRISWNNRKIETIELESRLDMSFFHPDASLDLAEAVDALVPMVWSHIRSGRRLPPGIERFAGFFSLR
jgi:hypothetical protein